MNRCRLSQRGFTLIEIVISMAIISVMLVAVLGTVGASQAMQFNAAQQSDALLLAEDLMAEVLRMPYEDPDQTPVFGLEGAEDTGDRSMFDDFDDYDGWSGNSPEYQDGTTIEWATAYERQVSVWWVEAADLNAVSADESGIKGVRVRVKYGDQTVATLFAGRSMSAAAAGGP